MTFTEVFSCGESIGRGLEFDVSFALHNRDEAVELNTMNKVYERARKAVEVFDMEFRDAWKRCIDNCVDVETGMVLSEFPLEELCCDISHIWKTTVARRHVVDDENEFCRKRTQVLGLVLKELKVFRVDGWLGEFSQFQDDLADEVRKAVLWARHRGAKVEYNDDGRRLVSKELGVEYFDMCRLSLEMQKRQHALMNCTPIYIYDPFLSVF